MQNLVLVWFFHTFYLLIPPIINHNLAEGKPTTNETYSIEWNCCILSTYSFIFNPKQKFTKIDAWQNLLEWHRHIIWSRQKKKKLNKNRPLLVNDAMWEREKKNAYAVAAFYRHVNTCLRRNEWNVNRRHTKKPNSDRRKIVTFVIIVNKFLKNLHHIYALHVCVCTLKPNTAGKKMCTKGVKIGMNRTYKQNNNKNQIIRLTRPKKKFWIHRKYDVIVDSLFSMGPYNQY